MGVFYGLDSLLVIMQASKYTLALYELRAAGDPAQITDRRPHGISDSTSRVDSKRHFYIFANFGALQFPKYDNRGKCM